MLLSCIGKILEKIIKERLDYQIEHKLKTLQTTQCGFRKGQSTLDVLLRLENIIRESFKTGKTCITLYIDLKSAYDKVWREGLMYKIKKAGIVGRMSRWLTDYLQNRKFRVSVEGAESDVYELNTGVPQGAILSPILFNVMLSDLPIQENIKVLVYADDITIVSSNKSMIIAKKEIQKYIKELINWSEKWGLVINPDKTKLQYFSLKREKSPIIRIKNEIIEYKSNHKLLGLILDSPRLKFNEHVKYLIANCTKRINILKALASTNWGACTKHLRQFYIAYIKSKIIYGIEIYGAANEGVMEKLEKVQNSCLRLILGARRTSPIISLQAETNIEPIRLSGNKCSSKLLIKLINRQREDETIKQLNIKNVNIEDMSNYPVNSFVRRSKLYLNMIGYKGVARRMTKIMKIPPWQSIGIHIVAENKDINDNPSLMEYIEQNYNKFSVIYTDGSKTKNTDTERSVASAVYNSKNKMATAWKLNPIKSVLGSELFGILKALESIKEEGNVQNYIIFSDSMSALQMIRAGSETYVEEINEIQNMVLELNKQRKVKIHWIKRHIGIKGNEIADKTANLGHKQNRSVLTGVSREEQLDKFREVYKIYWNKYWKDEVNVTQKGKFLRAIMDNISQKQIIKF